MERVVKRDCIGEYVFSPKMASFSLIFYISRLREKGEGWRFEGLRGGDGRRGRRVNRYGKARMPINLDNEKKLHVRLF